MSEFSDLMAAGLAQTVAEIPTKFTFRNKSFTGIYSELSESDVLAAGGFEQELTGNILIPFSQVLGGDPEPDEDIFVNEVLHKVGRPVTKDEVSWFLTLVAPYS